MFDKEQLNKYYQYCYALNGNEADAYDLLQSALEKYFRYPPKIEAAKNSYMRKIIRNLFIDNYRSEQKYDVEEFDESNITMISDEISSLESLTIHQTDAQTVWQLLDSSEREIMYLWSIQGLTTSEVAEYLDTPKGTIVSKVSRLRKKISKHLNIDISYGVA